MVAFGAWDPLINALAEEIPQRFMARDCVVERRVGAFLIRTDSNQIFILAIKGQGLAGATGEHDFGGGADVARQSTDTLKDVDGGIVVEMCEGARACEGLTGEAWVVLILSRGGDIVPGR